MELQITLKSTKIQKIAVFNTPCALHTINKFRYIILNKSDISEHSRPNTPTGYVNFHHIACVL